MTFIKKYWTSVLILFAVVASFMVSRADTRQRDKNITNALVVACAADSKRTALNAAGFAALSERVGRRDNAGDTKSARRYMAVSSGVITLIPAPIGQEGTPQIAEVILIDTPGLEPRFRITKRAQQLQIQGCKDFYGVG